MAIKKNSIWNRMFTCAFIANFMLCISQFIVNPLVATYADYLGADQVLTGVISGLYFGVAFAARPVSGPVITILNKKKIMIFAYTLGMIVNLGYAFPEVYRFLSYPESSTDSVRLIGSLNLTSFRQPAG